MLIFFSLFLGSQPKPSHRPEVETCYESSSILNTCTHSNSAQKNFLIKHNCNESTLLLLRMLIVLILKVINIVMDARTFQKET